MIKIFIGIFILGLIISVNESNKNRKNESNKTTSEQQYVQSEDSTIPEEITIEIPTENNIDYSMYYKKDYVMTQTELNFYRKLKPITDKLDLTIFPEVDLERIINVYNSDTGYRNRIKSRCIDYTIVNNKNCRIICCIELDDYTHNRNDRKQRDKFINELFEYVGLKLFRIKVGNYDFDEIENNIKNIL